MTDPRAVDPAVLERMLRLLLERTGYDLTGYRLAGIARRAGQRAAVVGFSDLDRYLERVAEDQDEAEALLDHLLVQVSGWFRDAHVWQALRAALPALAGRAGDRGVRAWVAGCGEGQEVWTVAACLAEAVGAGRLPSWWLLATDVDAHALRLLHGGRYPRTPLSPDAAELLEPHLEASGPGWQVSGSLAAHVSIGRHDVREAPPEDAATPFDLVLCRNVLMYLDDAVQVTVLDGLLASLRPGGLLVLGQAELPIDRRDALVPVDLAARVYRSIAAPVPG
ncbi:CheR family methyltransferase [Aquipuribacter sp. MA13-6]|uniref:CheR family methyltransferase n=1 Tax=unclassified Aquipuribacter TaxID=2635084 RepID=UPI003EEC98A0